MLDYDLAIFDPNPRLPPCIMFNSKQNGISRRRNTHRDRLTMGRQPEIDIAEGKQRSIESRRMTGRLEGMQAGVMEL